MEKSKSGFRKASALRFCFFVSQLLLCVSVDFAWCQDPAIDAEVVVVDAESGQPVPEFRVIPASFRDYEEPTWQYQYMQELSPQENRFVMKRGWAAMQLRIEAEGYATYLSEPFKRSELTQLKVGLEKDAGIEGVVVTPAGMPAKKTTIAICTRTQEVTVRNGLVRTRRGRGRSPTYSTRSDGSFKVPSEPCVWVLVFSHPGGYAERTKQELEANATVKLEPWGNLTGVARFGGEPKEGLELAIGTGRGDVDVILHYSASAITDEDGRYAFAKLPPRKLSVSPVFRVGDNAYMPMHHMIDVKSGETTIADLPRSGQRVVGKVSLPEILELESKELVLSVKCFLRPPSVSGPPAIVKQDFNKYRDFMSSEAGKSYAADSIKVKADGKFSIAGLPEGNYVVQAFAHRKGDVPDGRSLAFAARRIEVKPATADAAVLNLGDFPLRPTQ